MRHRDLTIGLSCIAAILLGLIIMLLSERAEVAPNEPPPTPAVRPWMIAEPECTCLESGLAECDDPEPEYASPPEDRLSRDVMVREVTSLWNLWFDDERAPQADPRRATFDQYAGDVADAVVFYQDHPTDIGGQLPGTSADHLIVAYMLARESSVTPDLVGALGEVGMGQLHGTSLAGYDPETVRHNARLGIQLMVRWLASCIPGCPRRVEPYDLGWTLEDWIGPLSLYAGGGNARKKDGTCAKFKNMRDRVATVRLYADRIKMDAER